MRNFTLIFFTLMMAAPAHAKKTKIPVRIGFENQLYGTSHISATLEHDSVNHTAVVKFEPRFWKGPLPTSHFVIPPEAIPNLEAYLASKHEEQPVYLLTKRSNGPPSVATFSPHSIHGALASHP